ncbi:MAG: carboxypeptidase regulatory-like domain-containing protein [Candidatus Eremiobacteraeota bacterium]|nr:carboxypeptidase regulatory-like domain-containing protein [Candidatus Eremiobacteraeota bacterium]
MNRTLHAAMALVLVTLLAVPARGQTPLIVGSVRDQQGSPIVGALVTGETAAGPQASATTDERGTFALHAAGVVAVRVACRFCRGTRVEVRSDEPVVAIVRRYQALADDSPSPSDLTNLPYANVESSVALRPFTLLAQTSAPYPGSIVSDRGLSASGSVLIDDGAPAYDITSGESPYGMIPASYEQSAGVSSASDAFLYGNQAAGGIVTLDPFLNGSSSEVATVGSDAIGRAQLGSDAAGLVAGTFSNDEESRQRTDLFASVPLDADQSVTFAGGSEQGRWYGSPSALANSFSFTDATFNDPRSLNLSIGAVADRGGYATNQGEYPISAGWSDFGIRAGVHTTGAFVGFADAGIRSSTGFYDQQALPYSFPRVGAMLVQTSADAGFEASGNDYSVVGGVGAFWIDYSGGTGGTSQPAKTALAVPSLQAQLFPNGRWSVDLQGSGSFTLPTFVEQYLYAGGQPMPVQYLRNALYAGALTYTDLARVRFSFEAATEHVAGAWTGTTTSAGFAATWQVAPAISLRAWTMHVTDSVPLYGGGMPYNGIAPTVGALWLTYDSSGTLRGDLIYRRDLLDAAPFYHVDGAISGPIANRLRWYAGAEDRMRRTFVDFGLRFEGR